MPGEHWPVRKTRRGLYPTSSSGSAGVLFAVLLFVVLGLGPVWLYASQGGSSSNAQLLPRATARPADALAQTPEGTAAPNSAATLQPSVPIEPDPALPALPDWATGAYLPLPEGKWIEVDIARQVAVAHIGRTAIFSVTVSTGGLISPASAGKYPLVAKDERRLLTGPGYYLPDVPWVLVTNTEIMLHGAYWLDHFGAPSAYGSINLNPEDARLLYLWADIGAPDGETTTGSGDMPTAGTWLLIHN